MKNLEDDLRAMYRTQASAMQTPDVELGSVRQSPTGRARTGARVVALSAAAVLALAAGAALLMRQTTRVPLTDDSRVTESKPAASDVQAPRFVPTVPDGWVLLDVSAGEGHGDWGDASSVYTRLEPAARLELHHSPGAPIEAANTNLFTVGDRHGSWDRVNTIGHVGVSFDVVVGGQYVMVQGVDVDADTATVTSLAQAITVSTDGVPVLDASAGFTLEAAGVGATTSQYLGYLYGRADDPDARISMYAESAPGLLDAALLAGGVFDDPVDIDGQRYWASPGGTSVTWSAGTTRYSVNSAAKIDLIGLARTLRPADDAEIRQLAASIGSESQLSESTTVRLNRNVTLELRTQGALRFVCLDTVKRVCRHDNTDRSQPGVQQPISILLGDDWYIIEADPRPAPPATAITTTSNGWRISLLTADTGAVRIILGPNSWTDLERPIL